MANGEKEGRLPSYSDITEAFAGALAGVMQTVEEKQQPEDDDPRVVVGNTYTPGAGAVDVYKTQSQMEANILSWASSMSPAYTNYANMMVDAGFMPETYMDQPTNAAYAIRHPIALHRAYRAQGGRLPFNEWLDWYSSTRKRLNPEPGPRGPVRQVSRMNAADVDTMADTTARTAIGRGLSEDESKEALRAVRAEEKKSFFDNEDITVEERRRVLQEVIKDNPEFVPYQFDTTVLDAMASVIDRGEAIRNG